MNCLLACLLACFFLACMGASSCLLPAWALFAALGSIWARFCAFWSRSWPVLGPLRRLLAALGPILAALGRCRASRAQFGSQPGPAQLHFLTFVSFFALFRSWTVLSSAGVASPPYLRRSWPLLSRSWPPKMPQVARQDGFRTEICCKTSNYKKH